MGENCGALRCPPPAYISSHHIIYWRQSSEEEKKTATWYPRLVIRRVNFPSFHVSCFVIKLLVWNGFLLQERLTGAVADPCPRRLLRMKVSITYSHDITGDGGTKNGKDKDQRESSCPAFMPGSLSNLAGVSGGTGERMVMERLEALSMEKPLFRPRTWLQGLTQPVLTVLACGCSFSLSGWPHYSTAPLFQRTGH